MGFYELKSGSSTCCVYSYSVGQNSVTWSYLTPEDDWANTEIYAKEREKTDLFTLKTL